MNRRLSIAAFALTAATGAFAAELPASSVLALFNRIPELPATAQEATRWVDKQGHLVHPGLLALKADIKAHQQAMDRLGAVADERHRAQSTIVVADLGQGMADVGIDMARMQRDPVYAQQVQDRLRKLSPQEAMALSQRMSQPMNQDPRLQNAAKAMVEDASAVKAAAEAGETYSHAQMTRQKAHDAIWREAEAAADAIRRKPLNIPAAKPAMEWENIGCEAPCRAQWEAYASQALQRMIERDTQILQARRAAVQRQRAAVAGELKIADAHLLATRYGAASQSQVNQMKIASYDGAAIGELTGLIDRITDSAKSAAVVVNCGKQTVLVPGAVCQ
jgi:hypothetical protein